VIAGGKPLGAVFDFDLQADTFYDALLTFLDHRVDEGALKPMVCAILQVANSVDEFLKLLNMG